MSGVFYMFQLLKQKNRRPVKHNPVCDIYMNKMTSNFILQNYVVTKEFDWTEGYGPLIYITNNEMKGRGIELVLSNLEEFYGREKTEKSEFGKMTPHQQRRFEKDHKNLHVVLEDNHSLVLWPMERCRGGYEGISDAQVYVKLPCSNEEFYKKLMEAFAKCE